MNSNMTMTIGNFKGTAKTNGVPMFIDKFPITIGGVMGELTDAAPAYFGRLVSVDPDAPNTFLMGTPAGTYPIGVLIADPAIMQNDPGMFDKYFEGRPATAVAFGIFQNSEVDPDLAEAGLGMEVWANRITGQIGYAQVGGTPPSGTAFIKLNASVFSKNGPNGTSIWLNYPATAIASSEAQPTVATPVATPVAGAVADNSTILLSCATPGSSIYYTIDGSTPDNTDTLYTSAGIVITDAMTLKAIAYNTGYNASAVLSAAYTIAQ